MGREASLEVVFRNNVVDGVFSIKVDGVEVIDMFSEDGVEYFTKASAELAFAKMMAEMWAEVR